MSDPPGPEGTEPTIFKIPTLGHAVCLGELYDQRTGDFLGVQLYPRDKIQETETDIRHTELSLSLSSSIESKASLLDINAKLSLSVLGGLVKVSGSASYLNDSKSNVHEQAFALALKMRLNEKRILFAEEELGRNVLEVAHEDYIGTKKATHFVSAVVYGGNFIVNLVARKSKLSEEEKVEGKLEAELNFLKGAVSLQGEVEAKIKGEFENMNDNFDLVIHGDVALEKVPINPQDVLDTFPDAASLITAGGGVPISVTLQPIPKKLITGSLVYELDADCVDTILKAFSLLDDLRSRFSVLVDRIKAFQEFLPELDRVIRVVVATFTQDHGKRLHELRKFLYDYQHGTEPDPESPFGNKAKDGGACGIGEKVLEAALELYNYHLNPGEKSNPPGQYPASLVGLENEYSKFEYFVLDIQRVRESLEPQDDETPPEKQSSIYLRNLDTVCRAARVQSKIPLFIMIPFAPASDTFSDTEPVDSDEVNADLAIVQFLAIIRNHAPYFKDTSSPPYILYAENLKLLERRLPNNGKFSGLKTPSLFIGRVDVQGTLSWSDPPLTPEPTEPLSLKLHHKPSEQKRGDIAINIPVNGTKSFSIQIQAKSPSSLPADQHIFIVQIVDKTALLLRFRTPLKVELEGDRRTFDIIPKSNPPLGQLFTATLVQDVEKLEWILYLGEVNVAEVYFTTQDLLQDSTNLQIAYPDNLSWWGGEVYNVKAFPYALNQQQVAAELQNTGATTN